jgi:RNA polymerase sigma-70 factor (ECF subfamily)
VTDRKPIDAWFFPDASSPSGRPSTVPEKEAEEGEAADRIRWLVQLAKRRDKDAFGAVYRLFFAPLYRMARLYVGEAAGAVVDETFLRAWATLPGYREREGPIVAWLYGIQRMVIQEELESRCRIATIIELSTGQESPTEERLDLSSAVQQLPDEERQILELRFLAGLSDSEVAIVLDEAPGSVGATQWRALEALRQALGAK